MLALLFACAVAYPAQANTRKPDTLIIAYPLAPPWRTLDAHGEPAGPYAELSRELARRLQLRLQFKICPVLRCQDAMLYGRADMMIGAMKSRSSLRHMLVLQPPLTPQSWQVVYQRRGDTRRLERYQDLLSLNVGVLEGIHHHPHLDADWRIQRDPAQSLELNFRKLAAGRIDALIGDVGEADYLARKPEFSAKVKRSCLRLRSNERHHLALSKKSPHIFHVKRISTTMQRMVDDGTVARIMAAAWMPQRKQIVRK